MTMMLATLQHTMPPAFSPSSATAPALNAPFGVNMTMAASLPIIPRGPAPPQRPKPKLSVNTAQPRSFGKGASLRLDTLSAVSPTRINTFSNAYPALDRPAKPRLCIDSSVPDAPSPPASASASASALSATPSSASTTASTATAAAPVPYKQPHNLTSVLANSPFRAILPRKMAASRPMFPAEKRVSFRTPLEENITTVKYTLAHSDLNASVSTLSSLASSASTDSTASATSHSLSSDSAAEASSSPPQGPPRAKHPRLGDKRDSSSSDDDSDSAPETPVAGRRKRTRDWRWTLGPVSGSDESAAASNSSSSTTSETATSEDSSS